MRRDFNDDEGLAMLGNVGWLASTPAEFRDAILSLCSWQERPAGHLIQAGGEEAGEFLALAQGVVEFRTVVARADTPLMHFVYPVFWFGYIPFLTGKARPLAATARTSVTLARIQHGAIKALLDRRPDWWRHLMPLAISYGDVASMVAADLLIRDGERRCAAVLLRLSGHRFFSHTDGQAVDVAITQEELGGAANLSHSSVHGMLKRLVDRGLVEQGYKGLKIVSPAALRKFVNG